jgi:drug/metabolite transporter (DMT)-like permease
LRRATLYVLVSAFLWGTSFPTIRLGLERGAAGPFTLLLFRFAVATLVLGLFALRTRHARTTVAWPTLAGLSLLNAVGYALQFLAQDRTSASKTSLLVDIDVIAIAVLGYFLLGERHGREILAALGLGVVGLVLLSTGGDPAAATFERTEFVGDTLAFAAGLVWAVYYVWVKRIVRDRPDTDALGLTLGVFTLTTVLVAPAAWLVEGTGGSGNAVAWSASLYLGVFATALPFFLWFEALRTESVTVVALMLLLEIVVAVALGVAFLGERLTGWALAGALLILAAAYLAARGTPQPPPAVPAPGAVAKDT